MKRFWKLAAVVACAGMLMVSCDDDDDDGGTTPGPTGPADVVGTWTGSLDLGAMAIDVSAIFNLDSMFTVAAMMDTVPMFSSVGTYSVEDQDVIFMGDTCMMMDMDSMTYGMVPCVDDTATVDGDTLRYSYYHADLGMSVPIGLVKTP